MENKITFKIEKQYKHHIYYVNKVYIRTKSWLKESRNKVMHVLNLNLWMILRGQKKAYSKNNAGWLTDKNQSQVDKNFNVESKTSNFQMTS